MQGPLAKVCRRQSGSPQDASRAGIGARAESSEGRSGSKWRWFVLTDRRLLYLRLGSPPARPSYAELQRRLRCRTGGACASITGGLCEGYHMTTPLGTASGAPSRSECRLDVVESVSLRRLDVVELVSPPRASARATTDCAGTRGNGDDDGGACALRWRLMIELRDGAGRWDLMTNDDDHASGSLWAAVISQLMPHCPRRARSPGIADARGGGGWVGCVCESLRAVGETVALLREGKRPWSPQQPLASPRPSPALCVRGSGRSPLGMHTRFNAGALVSPESEGKRPQGNGRCGLLSPRVGSGDGAARGRGVRDATAARVVTAGCQRRRARVVSTAASIPVSSLSSCATPKASQSHVYAIMRTTPAQAITAGVSPSPSSGGGRRRSGGGQRGRAAGEGNGQCNDGTVSMLW